MNLLHATACIVALLFVHPLATMFSQRASERPDIVGVWRYETLTPPNGQTTRLDGLFVFKDGYFVQEALNHGEPFDQQAVRTAR